MPSDTTSFDCGDYLSSVHYSYGLAAIISALACGGIAWQFDLWFLYGGAALFFLIAVGSLSSTRLSYDPRAGSLTRERHLFGQWLVRSASYPVEEFKEICYRRVDPDAEARECVWVGLRRRNGRFWLVGLFGAGHELNPASSADYLARALAEATGLEIRGTAADPASPFPPERVGYRHQLSQLCRPRRVRPVRRDL